MANAHLDQSGTIPAWDLSDRLSKALKHAGVKPGEMAAYLGVSPAGLRNWTSGKVRPKTAILRLWAMRCGVDYQWLRTGAIDMLSTAPDLGGSVRARGDSNTQPSDPRSDVTYLDEWRATA